MQLSLAGGSYVYNPIDINNQRCINWIPFYSGIKGRGEALQNGQGRVLVPTAGCDSAISLGRDAVRSMVTVRDYTYVTINNSVYRLTFNVGSKTIATHTLIGTLLSSVGYMYVAANPTQIMWVDGTYGYIYNDQTDTFSQITDPQFPGASSVVFVDGYFIVSKPNSGEFYFSDLNDGTAWDPLAFATAESNTDNIVTLATAKGELWIIGTNSAEIWYNAGNAQGAPFSPREGLSILIGCQAAKSVVSINDLLVWLDNRGYIVQAGVSSYTRNNNSGYQLNILATDAITEEIIAYSTKDDAIAITYNDRGHLMYQITFPTEQKTWVYDFNTNEWHERLYYDTGVEKLNHHLGQFSDTYGSLTIMAGIRDGNIYIVDNTYLDDNGIYIRRHKISPFMYDKDGCKLITIYGLVVKIGQINVPITVSDPQIGMRYSIDGGHTWSVISFFSLGEIGEYDRLITWNALGTAYQWVFEFIVSDPVSVSIADAWLNAEVEQ